MDLIHLVIALAVIGVILYLIQTYLPMPQPIKIVITVLIVIFACVILLDFAGIGSYRIGSF